MTLNNREEYATLTKKSKSPILQISKTIIRPDRPQIFKRRADSESEDDDEDSIAKTDYSDLLSDVLGMSALRNFFFGYHEAIFQILLVFKKYYN